MEDWGSHLEQKLTNWPYTDGAATDAMHMGAELLIGFQMIWFFLNNLLRLIHYSRYDPIIFYNNIGLINEKNNENPRVGSSILSLDTRKIRGSRKSCIILSTTENFQRTAKSNRM